ncbi:Alpha/Beta hydrolase protein [Microdochium bolleyi]|uniref:Alpha/Beta hydrolase protein n=1 Tax=Microdochium bolleyi TaxID=196109 RepID=A0A136IQM7_9PEZI|nr:Alpha/Beta hydrolase protein [Microdochium bolleyi]
MDGHAAIVALPPSTIANPSPPHQHTHTVVFLHGRGDNAPSFSQLLAQWRDSSNQTLLTHFPTFRWVFPQAPVRRVASSPNGGSEAWPQWFDVWNVRDFADNEGLQAEGLREVIPAIRQILADEAALLGGRWDKVVLAGISMGAATGAHVLFNLNISAAAPRLGAFLGFSCRCPFAGRPSLEEMRAVLWGPVVSGNDDAILRNTPVLLEHCIDDPLVLVENGREMGRILTSFGATVERREYPAGGHWFNSPHGLDDMVHFLKVHLS